MDPWLSGNYILRLKHNYFSNSSKERPHINFLKVPPNQSGRLVFFEPSFWETKFKLDSSLSMRSLNLLGEHGTLEQDSIHCLHLNDLKSKGTDVEHATCLVT